jgi:hypothetical protein
MSGGSESKKRASKAEIPRASQGRIPKMICFLFGMNSLISMVCPVFSIVSKRSVAGKRVSFADKIGRVKSQTTALLSSMRLYNNIPFRSQGATRLLVFAVLFSH